MSRPKKKSEALTESSPLKSRIRRFWPCLERTLWHRDQETGSHSLVLTRTGALRSPAQPGPAGWKHPEIPEELPKMLNRKFDGDPSARIWYQSLSGAPANAIIAERQSPFSGATEVGFRTAGVRQLE
jgi:hypothetical protein